MMIIRKCLCSVLAAFALANHASAKVTLVFQNPGAYMVTVRAGDKVISTLPPGQDTKALDINLPKPPPTGPITAEVQDLGKGNEATFALPASGKVDVKPEKFDTISRVTVAISDGKGAVPDTGVATLRDGKGREQTTTLLPQDGGKATFQHVAAGDGLLRFQQGAAENHQATEVRLPLQRSTAALDIPVAITLPNGMHSAAPPPAPKSAGYHGGLLTGLVGFLIALGVLALAALLVMNSLRRKGITATSLLEAAGVQLPEDQEPVPLVTAEPPPPVDPNVCPFCGSRKDPNGPCPNCSVAASPQAAPRPSAVVSSGPPRLVALAGPRAGEVFPVSASMTVGRDPSRDVSITDDPSLSRQHATIESTGAGVSIADGGSSNGTWVNGRKVDRADLRPGDEIVMGASRFRYEA